MEGGSSLKLEVRHQDWKQIGRLEFSYVYKEEEESKEE
jgi:hypothetical protein